MIAAGQTDQAARILRDLVFRHRAFTFWHAQFHACQEPAKILIAFPGFGEKRIADTGCGSDFSADVRLYAGFLRSEVEPWRAVNSVAIEERNRRHRIFGAYANKFFGQGSALEKAECGAGMELDVCRTQS